jgi:L-amino acid N-acyltransferase YncA
MNGIIRLAIPADCARIATIYAPYVLNTAISFETEPPSEQELRQRIQETLEFLPWLVCTYGDQVVGYAYADRYRTRAAYQWSSWVSVYIDSRMHRSGVGRGLYTSLFKILELQGFYNLFAGITLPNEASVELHRSFGFQQIALERSVGYKLGHWHDVSIWQLPLRECSSTPENVRPVESVAKSGVWLPALSAGLPFLRARS